MIITSDPKTNTWVDLIESGTLKNTFLNIYENKPPKFNEFELFGYRELQGVSVVDIYLTTNHIPPPNQVLWGGRAVVAVNITLRMDEIEFYSTNLWYSPDETTDMRMMKQISKSKDIPPRLAMLIVEGGFTTRVKAISLREITPTAKRG